jgi:endoglucanase
MKMKNSGIVFLVMILLALACEKVEKTAIIKTNQLGYYPKAVKRAVVVESKASEFEIKSPEGKSVFTGKLSEAKYWDKSGENVRIADFSDFTEPGSYILTVKDGKDTGRFEIKDNLYRDAFKATLKNFYYIRASMDIEEKYAGKWHRKKGHPDDVCYFHPSALRGDGKISSPGGWYDAGDCNKYVVNGGISVGTILNLFELYPNLVGDNFSNIPESGNGLSDLLDEVKYELDWVLTMQAPDGGAHMKLTSKNFTAFIMPEMDTTKRFVVGKATAPSLNFAAMMAQASRLYGTYDAKYASKCLSAAEKAWAWAEKNPKVVFKNPADVHTGEYGDSDLKEEFWWAAAELYLSSKKQDYLDYLLKNEPYVAMDVSESWRKFIGNLGSFSIILADSSCSKVIQDKIKTSMIGLASGLLQKLDTIPYHVAIDDFQWGSNSDIVNSAIIFAYAYKLTGEQKYLDAVVETTDYIFGKNATDYSFLTGFGHKTPMHLHNRVAGSDGIDEPAPGFLVGGPNNNREDDKKKNPSGVEYPVKIPAKSYLDLQDSYASNETCINWNAPMVFILGFLEANADKLQ